MAVDHNDFAPILTSTTDGLVVQTSVNTLVAGRFDFEIRQGQTLSLRVTWLDDTKQIIDVSAYTARLKIKDDFASSTTRASLTSSDGITLAATKPNIIIARTAAETAAYTGWLRARYDLELVTGSTVTRLLEGFVTLRREVTT